MIGVSENSGRKRSQLLNVVVVKVLAVLWGGWLAGCNEILMEIH